MKSTRNYTSWVEWIRERMMLYNEKQDPYILADIIRVSHCIETSKEKYGYVEEITCWHQEP